MHVCPVVAAQLSSEGALNFESQAQELPNLDVGRKPREILWTSLEPGVFGQENAAAPEVYLGPGQRGCEQQPDEGPLSRAAACICNPR